MQINELHDKLYWLQLAELHDKLHWLQLARSSGILYLLPPIFFAVLDMKETFMTQAIHFGIVHG